MGLFDKTTGFLTPPTGAEAASPARSDSSVLRVRPFSKNADPPKLVRADSSGRAGEPAGSSSELPRADAVPDKGNPPEVRASRAGVRGRGGRARGRGRTEKEHSQNPKTKAATTKANAKASRKRRNSDMDD